MAEWRRRALEAFPDLAPDIRDAEFSLHDLFRELVPKAMDAHRADDGASLDRIYGYARWCLLHPHKELWNPAGVSFYEHLFEDWDLRRQVASRLDSESVDRCVGLWELMLDKARFEELKQLLKVQAAS